MVTNTSKRDGDEVAQLYLTGGEDKEAIRTLRGFKRVHIPAGESRTVEFQLEPGEARRGGISVAGSQPAAANTAGAM